jgi:transposase
MERKVKYDYEFKVQCVQEALKNYDSVAAIAKQNKISRTNLRKWISFYQKYGYEGLFDKKNQNYSADFKLRVLNTIEEKGISLNDACLIFNIPSQCTVLNWQRKYAKEGLAGLKPKPKGRPRSMNFKRKQRKTDKPLTREEELLLENESLRAENELLKKLQALIQAEEAEQNKKRKP